MSNSLTRRRPDAAFVVRIIGIVLFAYFFFGFMLVPCLNTLTLRLSPSSVKTGFTSSENT